MTTTTPEALVSAYSAATAAYAEWEAAPRWRKRKRRRLRARAEVLALTADHDRALLGVESHAVPLLALLDMQRDDRIVQAAR